MKTIYTLVLSFFICSTYCQICGNNKCEEGETEQSCIRDCLMQKIELFLMKGGRVDWLHNHENLITFDKQEKDGYYDIYIVNADGTGLTCITCSKNEISAKHNGQPAWHPSGEWIIFQSEKNNHPGNSKYSTPGRGVYCDLWLVNKSGTKFYQLSNLPVDNNYGVLHPHFSKDGKQLSWSEMFKKASLKNKGTWLGSFKLKIADFYLDDIGVPHLSNIKEFIPGDSVFYENHGFSPDGKYLLFTSNYKLNATPLKNNNIYKMEISTGKITQLTFSGYNEHASYSPSGNYIIWGTNMGNKNKGMDYWIMNNDGSNKQRLTYFNIRGYAEYCKKKLFAVDMSWNADGKSIIAYVQDNLAKDAGRIYIIKFRARL